MNENNSFIEEYKKLLTKTIIPSEDKFEELYRPIDTLIKQNMKPLFRFRAYNENSVNAFRDDQIFHSNPINFNDPYDCLLYFDINHLNNKIRAIDIPHILNEYHDKKCSDTLPEEIKWHISQFENKGINIDLDTLLSKTDELNYLLNNIYVPILQDSINNIHTNARKCQKIACFSENINSILMWSHYADYHKGFAIEYDFLNTKSYCDNCNNQKTCPNYSYMHILPVIYSAKRFDATNIAEIFAEYHLARKFGINIKIDIKDHLVWIKSNIYKSLVWEYEYEWRSILYCRNQKKMSIKMKPKSVYLGCAMSFEHESVIIRLAIEKGIPIKKTKAYSDNNGFELKFEEYN